MRVLKLLVVACLSLALQACYDLPFPAGSLEQATFDPDLTGAWEKIDSSPDSRSASMQVQLEGEKLYRVQYRDAEDIHYTFRVHINQIGELSLLSIRHPKEDQSLKPNYAIYRYRLKKNSAGDQTLEISMMKVGNPAFQRHSDFVNWLHENMTRRDELFEGWMSFRRKS